MPWTWHSYLLVSASINSCTLEDLDRGLCGLKAGNGA